MQTTEDIFTQKIYLPIYICKTMQKQTVVWTHWLEL